MSRESPVLFDCRGSTLTGILHCPDRPGPLGVVVVTGGPQYRVGSHRQFVLLARRLADDGFTVLRFDCRGMGDSAGEFPGFEGIGDDIRAAIDTIASREPRLRGIVLWGLCDAASAALIYARGDPRVAGLVLLNPWVRSQPTLARAQLRSYYLRRIRSREFWRKLSSGALAPLRSLRELAGTVRASAGGAGATGGSDFVTRMREGFRAFDKPVLIILSGDDITAAEFRQVSTDAAWAPLVARPQVQCHSMPCANHTFSTAAWRDEVAECTGRWLAQVATRTTNEAA